MNAHAPPPAARSSWWKPLLILFAVLLLLVVLGVAALLGLGWFGWKALKNTINEAQVLSQPRQALSRPLSADEQAIVDMVLERNDPVLRESSAGGSQAGTDRLEQLLAGYYQRSLNEHANGGQGTGDKGATQKMLATLLSALEKNRRDGGDAPELSPELSIVLEALAAQYDHGQNTKDGVVPLLAEDRPLTAEERALVETIVERELRDRAHR